MKYLRRMLASILTILAAVWLIAGTLVYLFQDRLVYYPDRALVAAPSDAGLSYEDANITTEDGVSIHGWFLPHSATSPVLLFLHGNAGNISHRLESLRIFHQLGLAVLIIDYRGFGRSGGRASEQGTYRDALAAWRYLTTVKRIDPGRIIVFGRSLGAAVAVWLAREQMPSLLIMESPFTSMAAMGRHYYPWLPVSALARIHYPSIDRIADVHCPVLVIHSPDDDLIPYQFGREIFAAAAEPKRFLTISGGHNDGFLSSGESYTRGLAEFIGERFGPGVEQSADPAL